MGRHNVTTCDGADCIVRTTTGAPEMGLMRPKLSPDSFATLSVDAVKMIEPPTPPQGFVRPVRPGRQAARAMPVQATAHYDLCPQCTVKVLAALQPLLSAAAHEREAKRSNYADALEYAIASPDLVGDGDVYPDHPDR